MEMAKKERKYIEKCYYDKMDGIPDPWMKYPKHEDWDIVVERIKCLNTDKIWAERNTV